MVKIKLRHNISNDFRYLILQLIVESRYLICKILVIDAHMGKI